MAGPRTRSKKVDKVPSQVDVAYLGSIEEMEMFGAPDGDHVLLYDYQYRLEISEEFPAVAVRPLRTEEDDGDCELYFRLALSGGIDVSAYAAQLSLDRIPEVLYWMAVSLYEEAVVHGPGYKPRFMTLTVRELSASNDAMPRLTQLFAEPQELPVTYDLDTGTLTNYNPQPAQSQESE